MSLVVGGEVFDIKEVCLIFTLLFLLELVAIAFAAQCRD
jgi:hypothetical protein